MSALQRRRTQTQMPKVKNFSRIGSLRFPHLLVVRLIRFFIHPFEIIRNNDRVKEFVGGFFPNEKEVTHQNSIEFQ